MLRLRRKRESKEAVKKQPRLRPAWPAHWWAGVLAISALTLAALANVGAKHAVVRLGYALSQAAQEREKLLADQRKLQVEMASLRSPNRLRKLAQDELGLMEPSGDQILRLSGADPKKIAARSLERP